MLQVGLLGARTMGQIHAQSIANSEVAKLAAIYSPDPDGRKLAGKLGAKAVKSPDDIFKNDKIDVVVIASPTDTHAEYLAQAKDAGKHIFCEKPAVRTEEQAKQIEKLFRNYPKKVTVGHVLHFSPAFQQLKSVSEAGTLGNIGTIRLTRCGCFPCGVRAWFADAKRSGGVILDLMLHDLDVLRWCFGDLERLYTARAERMDGVNADYAIIVGRMKSGAIAHLEGSWAEGPGTFYYGYEIAGSTGLLEFDSRLEPTLQVQPKVATKSGKPGVMVPSSPCVLSPYEVEMRSFLQAVAEDREPEVSLNDGIAAVRLALAAIKSAETDRAISFK